MARITVAAACDRYEDEVSAQKRPLTREREALELRWVRQELGEIELARLGVEDVARYRDARLLRVSVSTVCRELDVLRHLCRVARLERGVPMAGNPAQEVRQPTRPRAGCGS